MSHQRPQYPDISDILAQKAAGRLQNAARSFAAKLAILDALRERAEPFIQARRFRSAQQVHPAVPFASPAAYGLLSTSIPPEAGLQIGHHPILSGGDVEPREQCPDIVGVAAA